MAGGPNAKLAPCIRCAEAATRVREGLETDGYLCGSCGAKFTLNFDDDPAPAPLWPITPEHRAAILAMNAAGRTTKEEP